MITHFRTHNGERIDGTQLLEVLKSVAADLRKSAYAVRHEDSYANHVWPWEKDQYLREALEYADSVEAGTCKMSFALWQLMNTKLTGECVPFLSK